MAEVPAEFFSKWQAYLGAISTANLAALGVALASLVLLVVWPRFITRIPAPFVVLVASPRWCTSPPAGRDDWRPVR